MAEESKERIIGLHEIEDAIAKALEADQDASIRRSTAEENESSVP